MVPMIKRGLQGVTLGSVTVLNTGFRRRLAVHQRKATADDSPNHGAGRGEVCAAYIPAIRCDGEVVNIAGTASSLNRLLYQVDSVISASCLQKAGDTALNRQE
jgi:hypothetical protein